MTKLYYQDDAVSLYLGNSLEFMANLENESIDTIITDPPYADRTHKNALKTDTKLGSAKIVNFESFTESDLYVAYNEMARITKSWIVSNIDYNYAFLFETNPPKNMTQKRIGVWVKTNYMPQLSGDRPSQGWEAISYLHKTGKRSIWNGSGKSGNYVSNVSKSTGHPTPKPLTMVSSFVERFTNYGDTILDPFAGGGNNFVGR